MTTAAPLVGALEWGNSVATPGFAGYGPLTAGGFPGAGAVGVGPGGIGPVGVAPAPGAQIPTDLSGAIPPGVSRFLGLAVLILAAGYFDIRVFRRRYG